MMTVLLMLLDYVSFLEIHLISLDLLLHHAVEYFQNFHDLCQLSKNHCLTFVHSR
ncbi:unnamed protein product [Schistosoma curassoni]|uniref:Ovule protein n=1 Tax=Schistosoma curassoni TaxID=6186 RepID=A0A183L0V9_9TREM|nr:unnamed protein product [Schistosoma curassoni]